MKLKSFMPRVLALNGAALLAAVPGPGSRNHRPTGFARRHHHH